MRYNKNPRIYDEYEEYEYDENYGGTFKMKADKKIRNRSDRHAFRQQLRQMIQSGDSIEQLEEELESVIDEIGEDFAEKGKCA